jgi:hypothetical protein
MLASARYRPTTSAIGFIILAMYTLALRAMPKPSSYFPYNRYAWHAFPHCPGHIKLLTYVTHASKYHSQNITAAAVTMRCVLRPMIAWTLNSSSKFTTSRFPLKFFKSPSLRINFTSTEIITIHRHGLSVKRKLLPLLSFQLLTHVSCIVNTNRLFSKVFSSVEI